MQFDPSRLAQFPSQPGVYLMKGRTGIVLYVGKAKNLRQRLKQYFVLGGDGRFMVPFLVAKVVDIETIVVSSEKEALLLENNLIKKHRPKYNVLLKDDKSYTALKVTHKDPWPMVTLVRYRGKPAGGALYFGPYTSAFAARKTLDLLHRIFPLRQCSDQEFTRRTRPCILYGIKQCLAPCVNKCTKEEYSQNVQYTIQFLRGQNSKVIEDLQKKMQEHSDALEFEKAAELREAIYQIEQTVESQYVDKPLGNDSDAVGLYREAEEVTLCQLIFREGRLIGSHIYNFSEVAQEESELLRSFLMQVYEGQEILPHEILISHPLVEDHSELEEILGEGRLRKVRIISPQRGDKVAMVEMAIKNAEATFKKDRDQKAITEKILLEMQEKLHLSHYPRCIECFDNSNISGTNAVAAMVVFTEGEKDQGRYRKYGIKTVTGPDDYSSMHEVLLRRYRRAKDENNLPDLVVVDGGKGQLNVALKVFEELNIITVDVIGLAKEEGRHDKGITLERVFIPNIKDPILLKRNSPVLFLLQKIRDEAHRVAIGFHRQRREKKVIQSALDAIPGIGQKKRTALLRHFGSVKKIKEATNEELQAVKSISAKDAKAVYTYFRRRV